VKLRGLGRVIQDLFQVPAAGTVSHATSSSNNSKNYFILSVVSGRVGNLGSHRVPKNSFY